MTQQTKAFLLCLEKLGHFFLMKSVRTPKKASAQELDKKILLSRWNLKWKIKKLVATTGKTFKRKLENSDKVSQDYTKPIFSFSRMSKKLQMVFRILETKVKRLIQTILNFLSR